MPTPDFIGRPPANYLFVAVPERFTASAVPGRAQLIRPAGSDDWAAQNEALRTGRVINIETDEILPRAPVRQGQVLAVPDRLTADMDLCVGPGTRPIDRKVVVRDATGRTVKGRDGLPLLKNEGYTEAPMMRTCADITGEPVAVGDTIHFDHTCLTDEAEVSPGVYRVPYWAVICLVERTIDPWRGEIPLNPHPIAGYLLLTRVWADDVKEAEVDSRIRKVRYGLGGLIAEVDVPPLPNEGILAWQGSPLRGTADRLQVGERVVFHGYKAHADKSRPLDTGHALVETIAGTEYLCVRQDYVLAVRELPLVEAHLLENETDADLAADIRLAVSGSRAYNHP